MSTATNPTNRVYDERFLPQHGFGSHVTFETIARYHRYLFRVYTPKYPPAVQDDSVFFVGARFDNFAPQTPNLEEMYDGLSGGSLIETATYEDCIQHLSWETRSRSPFVSATFNLGWAIWDAVRRFNIGMKHDVHIAVIDASSLSGKAVTTLQLLRRSPSKNLKHPRHSRWCRFAQDSQSVMIYGFVLRSAVLASVPLRTVIQNLPSYFLKTPSNSQITFDLPLNMIFAWDFMSKRDTNFRRFCQETGERFTRMPYQNRVREITVGSVRLALTLLNPWFHRALETGDIQSAVTRVEDLSALIAHWPEQSGSRDHAEMASLMRALIQLLAEEVRGSSSRTLQATSAEVSRLQKEVDDLLKIFHVPEDSTVSLGGLEFVQKGAPNSDTYESESSGTFPDSPQGPTGQTGHHQRSKLKVTIPTSLDSVASDSSAPSSASPVTPESDTSFTLPSHTKAKPFSQSNTGIPPSPNFSSTSITEFTPPPSPLVRPASPPTSLRIYIPLVPSPVLSSDPPSVYLSALKSPLFELPLAKTESELSSSDEFFERSYWSPCSYYDCSDSNFSEEEEDRRSGLHDAVSYAVTGFLVGAAITLCILSSQRRTMLYLT